MKFFIDSREHGTTSLVHTGLAPFQGPALLAYNDAQFRDEDWEGIQNLQRSVKAEDPFKVGKFGIGFNSVYHITGSQVLLYICVSKGVDFFFFLNARQRFEQLLQCSFATVKYIF